MKLLNKKSFHISFCAMLFLVIAWGRVCSGPHKASAGQGTHRPVNHPDAFCGENLFYDIGFWIINKAATGSIKYRKHRRGYIAVFEAETSGLFRLITDHRKEVMKSIMEYDQKEGRFRPLVFQEIFTQGDSEIRKTLSFDYEKGTFDFLLVKNKRKIIDRTRNLPERQFDDLLTFFYNLRMRCYGEVKEGKKLSICVLVKEKPSYISVSFDSSKNKKKGVGKYYAVLSMDRNITQAYSKRVSCWFSHDFIPLLGVVEDAYSFGDLTVRLR